MEVVATIVGKLWDCSFDATCRQFRYLCGYKDSVERLRIKAEKLEHTRERVQGKIDEATTKGEIILSDVTNWIQSVDGITKEAEHFREEEDKANKRCLKGLCINPWSRYRFGKEAERKIEAISILQQEGAGFESVSRQAPPPRNLLISSSAASIIPSSALSINFQSRELITRQIMEMLKDENVSIIGICGMGGVGKTTLANEISKQAIKKKLFDFVVMVVVSQTQNYVNIQRDIAKRLGFKLPDDDDVSARAHFLLERIMEKLKIEQEPKPKPEPEPEVRILIILDDVWEGIELGRVGIPFASKGCKIVLTSRIEDVCVEMNAKTFEVGTLPKEESWRLFRDVAGGIVDNPDINPIAREVADECGGLPLALVTVAGALKNRNKKSVWIDAKQQLKKSAPKNIRGMDRKVFASLKLSYDFLESKEEQSVFLLCCLFPEDFDIPIELLMKYGMGLRFFQEIDTVDEARCRIHALVSILIASFLLIPGKNEKHVKMHDVIRDFAIKLSKDERMFMVKAGIQLQNWPSADTFENFTGISWMYNDIREVPDGLEYPKLQALLLQENSSLVVSNNFFQGMRDVKVLDMSRIQILQLPQSLVLLANLTTLRLDDCVFGDKTDISLIGKLTNLEILSLNGTDIAEIPGNFGQLVKLKMFNLEGCDKIREIPQAVISCLKKLEYLHASNRHIRILDIELQVLSRKTFLHVVTEDATLAVSLGRAILSIRMPFLNSTSFDSFVIKIGYKSSMLFEESPPWSRILYLAGINNYQELDWAYSLTKITDALQLCGIAGLRNILTDLRNDGFNDLKYLLVAACREITYLVNTLECTPKCIVFNSLESLLMNHMELVEICHGPLPAKSFLKLKQMHLRFCCKMLNIVPSDLLQRLHSLESFEARGCLSVVYVFDFERLVIAKEETKFLSSLNHLKLWSLSNMMRIWNGDAKLISLCNLKLVSVHYCSKLRQVFPPALLQSLVSLEHMEIESCSSLEEIFGNEEEEEEDHQENEIVSLKIDHTATSPRLGNLVSIKISGCHKLKNLFSPSIAKGLVQLRTLEVKLCGTLEEIISDEKAQTGGSTDRITFPSLYQIDLGELDSLACFCARRCTIEFPALESLDIQKCPKMETFGRGDQAVTPKLVWMDNLNITLQQFFIEKQQEMEEFGQIDECGNSNKDVALLSLLNSDKTTKILTSIINSSIHQLQVFPSITEQILFSLNVAAMAADPFLSASAEKFVDCVYNAGSRQLGYLLQNKRERLQGKTDDAKTKEEIIFVDVQQWIADVDSMTIAVETFLADENKANKKCLKGWCINFRSCYRFSKEALRKIEDISQLLAKDFEAVSHPDPTPRTLPLAKGSSDAYESKRSLKKQVMEALNDENVSVIGICGIMVTTVCDQMDAQKIFAVETLSEEESWDMFRKLAGEVVENSEINPIAREVAAYCGGLPITIETVARALKNKNITYVFQVLSLSSSNVREIPVEYSQVTSLRLFDLTYCKLLRRIPQNVISCLGKLEELYMKNSFMEWNFGSNARVVELQASPNYYLPRFHPTNSV
ncbi:hypothetical protein EZV62_020927 [Acer yangbiense]|uniref:NB-ARC domain-containing protein n=1 Tax=Acer yangbiense TaxID=1000413 RepID=A0A5C7HFF0_9ROSI|nr:hypothetical protein EZV62_020927 [Acer yangbiense]